MDERRWARLQDAFARVHAATDDERARLLREIEATERDLADEVRALLAADAETGIMDVVGPRLSAISHAVEPRPPERVGAYRIIRELGRGGMGVIYLAARADGQFEQQVAIKLIGTGNADDPLHRRFLAERQILAGLVHPNIARLLDGGITADGHPYLVLEYIDGSPITAWCDQQRRDIRARLRLFADVCAAVQHAHQNLVIHRDLKPTNILVSGDGRVHLLDFGIAKLLDPDLGAASATRHELAAMTPEYASPEQVRGDPLTTASDIYSLGVLLYALLCGRPPYRLTSQSLAEVTRAVLDQDPEPPSARAARRDIAVEPRATSTERLVRELDGDLDAIVLMAMRKEPGRRYASADMLRQDIERYLAGMPVAAHRGGRRYRLEKFVRRHRVEVAGAALLFVGLLTGLTMAMIESRRANRERDRAAQALAQSEGVTDFLMELFRTGDADDTLPANVSALDLLERGASRANALSSQPAVQARLLDVVGQMSLHLGRIDGAQRLLEQAVAIRRTHPGEDSLDLAASLIHLGWVHRARNDLVQAREAVSEALHLRQAALPPGHPDIGEALYELGWLVGGPPQEALYRRAIAVLADSGPHAERRVAVLTALSTNLRRQGRLDEAVATAREALRQAEVALGPEHHTTGDAMIHLADHVRDIEGDDHEAERLYRRGLELTSRRFGERSIRLLHGLHSLGTLLSNRGDGEAEAVFRRAIAIRRSATGAEHPQVAEGLQLLARELARQRRFPEAEALQRQALAHTSRTLGPRHPVITNSRLPALAEILDRQGRHAEADAIYESTFASAAVSSPVQGEVRRAYGRLLLRRGDLQRAEQQLLRALEMHQQVYAGRDHPNVLESRRALMELYQRWGKPALVERYRAPPGRYVPY